MEIISPNKVCIAKCPHGLEEILADELRSLGAPEAMLQKRAVAFKADKETLYKINLHSRLAIKILVPLFDFTAKHPEELYKKIKGFDWAQILTLGHTFAVQTTVHSTHFEHSQYVALKTKDAIVDQFYENVHKRPNVDVKEPDIKIHVHISDADCNVFLDASGDPLFKRGYRANTGVAPINEVLAAGMLALSGWDPSVPLVDPMCGSGTLVIEAAMIATNTPASILRDDFGFMNWSDFDEPLWNKVKQAGLDQMTDSKAQIFAYDKELSMVRYAEQNAAVIDLVSAINFKRKDFMHLEPPAENGMIITNPPYDERIQIEDNEAFYKAIGDRFKQAFQGYSAWLISSNLSAIKRVGLRPSRKITLFNGKLECKFLKYELYSGSKKAKYANQA